jgi:hypothetical protein
MLLDRNRHKGTRLRRIRFAALAAVVILLGLASARTPGFFAFAAPQAIIPETVKPSPAPVLSAQVGPRLAVTAPPPAVPAIAWGFQESRSSA